MRGRFLLELVDLPLLMTDTVPVVHHLSHVHTEVMRLLLNGGINAVPVDGGGIGIVLVVLPPEVGNHHDAGMGSGEGLAQVDLI